MIKAEPKTILSFIATYFDVIRDLFDTQANEGIIRKETLAIILEKHKRDIKPQLVEYKIIRPVNDDFELRDVYHKLIEFILFEFRPLLPEEIEKFGSSISELFRKIQEGIASDKNILLERLIALSAQIKEFSDSVEKNSIRLLNETRELKANVNRIDYKEKIVKASFWSQYYITPLNKILDVNHSESISNKLLDISEYANQRQLNFDDEGIRQAFQKLYYLLRQTNDDLLKQSKVLTNDLLPLIDRIRTESIILTGWIEFLKNPYKITPPKFLKTDTDKPYSDKIYLNTKEYFEQFTLAEEAIVEEETEQEPRWIFRKSHYKKKLIEKLPLENFFDWCNSELTGETNEITNEKVFALTGLLFEEDLEVSFSEESETIKIKTATSNLNVPKLTVKRNGVSK
jgi:hypothetical protein